MVLSRVALLPSQVARLALLLAVLAPAAVAKDGFVFLGATGDNALRPNGVWAGLYEAFVGGVFDAETVGLHVAMNTPHTLEELRTGVLGALKPVYEDLQNQSGWKCQATRGDCSPEKLLGDVQVNIWEGRDADAQAANMTASLSSYGRVTVYLSIPPTVFGSWSKAAVDHWGGGEQHRVHIACEKPFGTSLDDAGQLHQQILDAGVPEANLHLVDHWIAFFMNKHLANFRKIVQPRLGLSWSSRDFSRIVITEYETRGLDGRGGFFDGVGQVRDMVQSHLLQVMALTLMSSNASSIDEAKMAILNSTSVKSCNLSQYDGFLFEPKLGFHASFADSTLCEVSLSVGTEEWRGVDIVIATGKDMGTTLYTIDFYQRDGPGKMTYEIGKEETGVAGIRLQSWPLKDGSSFEMPLPGFGTPRVGNATPNVTASGDGYILRYDDPGMYFPKPYATMAANLLTGNYSGTFVTYPECHRGWEIVTGSSPSQCLDPAPQDTAVYKPPSACGNAAPEVCWQGTTVRDLYNITFACTADHDKMYANVSLYQKKCHSLFERGPVFV